MTEAMPFLQKYDITFLRPLPIRGGSFYTGLKQLPMPLQVRIEFGGV